MLTLGAIVMLILMLLHKGAISFLSSQHNQLPPQNVGDQQAAQGAASHLSVLSLQLNDASRACQRLKPRILPQLFSPVIFHRLRSLYYSNSSIITVGNLHRQERQATETGAFIYCIAVVRLVRYGAVWCAPPSVPFIHFVRAHNKCLCMQAEINLWWSTFHANFDLIEKKT